MRVVQAHLGAVGGRVHLEPVAVHGDGAADAGAGGAAGAASATAAVVAARAHLADLRGGSGAYVALVPNEPAALGIVHVGVDEGGWTHRRAGAPAAELVLGCSVLSATLSVEAIRARSPELVKSRAPKSDDPSLGRDKMTAIEAAVLAAATAASRAADDVALSAASPAEGAQRTHAKYASELASCLFERRNSFTAEFSTTFSRPNSLRIRLEAALSLVNPPLLADLRYLRSASGARLAAANAALRKAFLASYPVLLPSDFRGPDGVPAVGYVYVQLVTMTASAWNAEYTRVFVDGDCRSQMFGGAPLSFGYKVVLRSMRAVSSTLGADDGATELTAFYIGKDCAAARPLARVFAGGTRGGNDNLAELVNASKHGGGHGVFISPLGAATLERRIVAFVPHNNELVLEVEAAVMCVLIMVPGAVVLNNSPTGESRRFLAAMPGSGSDARPAFASIADAVVADVGAARACTVRADKAGPMIFFTRRAMAAAEELMTLGNHVHADGTPTAPTVVVQGRNNRRFSLAQVLRAVLDEPGRRRHRVSLWADGCNCSFSGGKLCPHVLLARLWWLHSGRRKLWSDDELMLYQPSVVHVEQMKATAQALLKPPPKRDIVDLAATVALQVQSFATMTTATAGRSAADWEQHRRVLESVQAALSAPLTDYMRIVGVRPSTPRAQPHGRQQLTRHENRADIEREAAGLTRVAMSPRHMHCDDAAQLFCGIVGELKGTLTRGALGHGGAAGSAAVDAAGGASNAAAASLGDGGEEHATSSVQAVLAEHPSVQVALVEYRELFLQLLHPMQRGETLSGAGAGSGVSSASSGVGAAATAAATSVPAQPPALVRIFGGGVVGAARGVISSILGLGSAAADDDDDEEDDVDASA